jgi:phosphoribosylanthranilate isomerase
MRTRVKICCIASVEDAELAIEHGADALGLVGAMPSGPGVIDDATIAAIAAVVPPPVATFLLTSERTADAIAAHVARTGVSTVQIVSPIAAAESARLAVRLPTTPRVQVIHIEGVGALDLIGLYASHVHVFLLDSGQPRAAVPILGGTGQTHDWKISAAFVAASPCPVFLAGGLTPDNVAEAIGTVRPYGVDVCSGVRTDDGRLDSAKLRAFMEAVATADNARASR